MAIISFRSPQEGLDQYQKAIEMMSLIREIVNNPEVGVTIAKLSIKLSDAQELSESKKKAARDAEESIIRSKELLEEITKSRRNLQEEIKRDKSEIEEKTRKLERELQVFFTEKNAIHETTRKNNITAEERLSKSIKLNEQAAIRLIAAERLEKELSVQRLSHQESVAEFNTAQEKLDNGFNKRLEKYEAENKKLIEDQTAFNLRKKLFDDALKE